MPVCTKCGIDKPEEEFSLCVKNKNGLQHWCKVCKNAYNAIKKSWRQYANKSKQRADCTWKTRKLIKAGIIKRRPCKICRAWESRGGRPLEFHHPDYRYPEKGDWYCRLHHRQMPPGIFQQDCFDFVT